MQTESAKSPQSIYEAMTARLIAAIGSGPNDPTCCLDELQSATAHRSAA